MTVCIAALYENGAGAILASDHMITASIPMGYEFENEETSKIHALTEHTFALLAGDMLFGDQIVKSAQAVVADLGQQHAGEIAETLKKSYQAFRLSYIVDRYLAPRGLTFDTYYGGHNSLNPGLIQLIDQAMASEIIDVQLIVVGPTEAGFGIYIITNPGLAVCVNAIGFTAIGSGAPHVLNSLLGAKYKKSLAKSKVEKLVKEAKAISQVAPGVGKETSITVMQLKEDKNVTANSEETT